MKINRLNCIFLIAVILSGFVNSGMSQKGPAPEKSVSQPGECVFGIMADAHKDIMHDADWRVESFINVMKELQPDFIIQLGDFCRPYARNQDFLNLWNSFGGEKHHVLGNHDMDGGFSRDSTVAFYHSRGRYYSFEKKGFHFVILDGNDLNPSPDRAAGYAHYIGTEQQEWLKKDLGTAQFPSVIFSHQPLNTGIENAEEILNILMEQSRLNPSGRVIACFNGHDHANQVKQLNGIWFIEINSMSYDWLGEAYAHQSYSDSIHSKYPAIQYTAPYQDPLWALVRISSDGKLVIEGKKSGWVGPSPMELNHPGKGAGIIFSAAISDTLLLFR